MGLKKGSIGEKGWGRIMGPLLRLLSIEEEGKEGGQWEYGKLMKLVFEIFGTWADDCF